MTFGVLSCPLLMAIVLQPSNDVTKVALSGRTSSQQKERNLQLFAIGHYQARHAGVLSRAVLVHGRVQPAVRQGVRSLLPVLADAKGGRVLELLKQMVLMRLFRVSTFKNSFTQRLLRIGGRAHENNGNPKYLCTIRKSVLVSATYSHMQIQIAIPLVQFSSVQ